MFYCEPCRVVNDLPKSSSRWRGLCELCGEWTEDMNDVPSAALPDPVESPFDIPQRLPK